MGLHGKLDANPDAISRPAPEGFRSANPPMSNDIRGRKPHAYRRRTQARFSGCPDPPQALDADLALRGRHFARVCLSSFRPQLSRRAHHRRQHGYRRHLRDGAGAGQAAVGDGAAQALRRSRTGQLFQVPGGNRHGVLLDGHHARGLRQVLPRRTAGGRCDRLCLRRCRQRLHQVLRRFPAAPARQPPATSPSWPATSSPAKWPRN